MRLDHAAKVLVVSASNPAFPDMAPGVAVVSDRVMRERLFTSTPVFQFQHTITGVSREEITTEVTRFPDRPRPELNPQGIIRNGTEVKKGYILVSKGIPQEKQELNAEEGLLFSIFGGKGRLMQDTSLSYDYRDSGMVCGVDVKALCRAFCVTCGDLILTKDRKTCPHCKAKLERIFHDELPSDVTAIVTIDVMIRRELIVGDVLQDNKENSIVVARIVPQKDMPRFHEKPVDVLLCHGTSSSAIPLHRQSYDDRLGSMLGDHLTLKKITLQQEEKASVRSTGRYSLEGMPMGGVDLVHGQWITRETAQEMVRVGFPTALRELLSIKSDAAVGRYNAYVAMVDGKPVQLELPDTTRRIDAFLRCLCLDPMLHMADGRTIPLRNATCMEDGVSVSLRRASSDTIRSWSSGHVTERGAFMEDSDLKPREGGLYCKRIFGPTEDYECGCGRRWSPRYDNRICNVCGIAIEERCQRRLFRFGHIDLVLPVIHPWHFPFIAETIGWTEEQVEECIHFVGDGNTLDPNAGPLAIQRILEERGVDTTGIVLSVLPVLPQEVRPWVITADGNIAISDTTTLYRALIDMNGKLCTLLRDGGSEREITELHASLQVGTKWLFDNRNDDTPLCYEGTNKPYFSINEELFRAIEYTGQKRVDYSACGIVIPDSELPRGTIGLPRSMAQELQSAFLVKELKLAGETETIRGAITLMNQEPSPQSVQQALQRTALTRPVLIVTNEQRVQSFEQRVIDGEVVRMHPEDAKALGINFGGEKIMIHLPLSEEAVQELRNPKPFPDTSSMLLKLDRNAVLNVLQTQKAFALEPFDRVLLGIGR
ncbi:MAG: hypothetical protein Q7S16_05215 [bacterium]|nr:hypothetical protein [bacterium]